MAGIETFIVGIGVFGIILLVLAFFWVLFWKGLALWVSAREGKKWWFIAILIVNSFGILEIIYFVFFSETGKKYIQKTRRKIKRNENDHHDPEPVSESSEQ